MKKSTETALVNTAKGIVERIHERRVDAERCAHIREWVLRLEAEGTSTVKVSDLRERSGLNG